MLKVPQDSYVGVDAADSYHALRRSAAVWAGFAEAERAARLVSASDYLDVRFPLKNGLNAAMRSGREVVPDAVLKAVCELALYDGLNAESAPRQQSVKVGEIAVTYALPDKEPPRFAYVAALLADYLAGSGGVKMVPVLRG